MKIRKRKLIIEEEKQKQRLDEIVTRQIEKQSMI